MHRSTLSRAATSRNHRLTRTAATDALSGTGLFARADPRTAFAHRRLRELLLSYGVLRLCTVQPLVRHSSRLLELASRAGLRPAADYLLRHTMFRHFCGGETAAELLPVMARMRASGIGLILDLSVEVDLGSGAAGSPSSNAAVQQGIDRMEAAIVECIRTAGQANAAAAAEEPGRAGPPLAPFAAVKLTPLIDPHSLQALSSALYYARDLFDALCDESGRLGRAAFADFARLMPTPAASADAQRVWDGMQAVEPAHAGVAWDVFAEHISLLAQTPLTRGWFLGGVDADALLAGDPLVRARFVRSAPASRLTAVDLQRLDALVAASERVCGEAVRANVSVMIDAEQSYFQPAIDLVANHLSLAFNAERPVVYNTYQMYLADGARKLAADRRRHERRGAHFGAKMVRGAYMTSERARAAALAVRDPIHASKRDTDAAYDAGLRLMLDELRSPASPASLPHLFVASHNAASLERAVAELDAHEALGILRHRIAFGQLYGMSDHLTYTLARRGLRAYKYLPYGKVHETVPYLIRRAQENSAVLTGSGDDRSLLRTEIRRRLFGGLRSTEHKDKDKDTDKTPTPTLMGPKLIV